MANNPVSELLYYYILEIVFLFLLFYNKVVNNRILINK
jgi:hypothetical protein